jgi:DNA-binding NarL/FixJ family response regulator
MAPPDAPISVALVNDYEIIVEGLRVMLEPFADRISVVELVAGDTPDGVCDIALFDTFAGRRHALGRVREMLADRDVGKVVLYTWDAPAAFLDDATAARVDGVILKSDAGIRLVEALERVHRGDPVGIDEARGDDAPTVLSEREREVLALLAQGASNREIAAELYLSIDTVKTHVRHLFTKLEVSNRTRAALEAERFGVAPPAGRSWAGTAARNR